MLINIDTLKKVINCIQAIPDVYSVKRIQTSYVATPTPNPRSGKKPNKNTANRKKD